MSLVYSPGIRFTWTMNKKETGFPIDTAVIVYEKPRDDNDTGRLPVDGYLSAYEREALLYLDNENKWHDLSTDNKLKQLDDWVSQIIKKYEVPLMFDEEVRSQLLDYIGNHD